MKKYHSKKVVFLSPVYPFRGGIASFSERLAKQFGEFGWAVKCFTFTIQYPDFLFPGKNQYSEEAPPPLDITRSIHSLNPITWHKTAKLVNAFGPDLVICAHWMPVMSHSFTYILNRVDAHKLVLVHNLFPHESKPLDQYFIKRLMKTKADYLALSDSVFEQIQTHFPSVKVSKYQHPYYDHYGEPAEKVTATATLGLAQDRDYLLFFGLVRAYKGLSSLIEAMHYVKDTLPNLDLLVVGEFYEPQEKYDSMVEQYQLTNRITIVNQFVQDSQVSPYFNCVDVVVLPYTSATQSGIGQIATYFSKPLIVTNVGSLPQQTNHGELGIVVEPNSKAIAEGILQFFSMSPDQHSTMLANIQAQQSLHTWLGLYNHITNLAI
jgi:D-inositol-3-phosphate glycosyltransferase